MGNAPSSTAWDTIHTRTAALRDVVATLDAGHDLPRDVATAEPFADRDDLLQALHGVWSRRLQGRIDLALEVDERPLDESVAAAWIHTAAELPGVRRVLDEHADQPALRRLERRQLRAIAVAAGLATFDDPIARSATAGSYFVRGLRGRTRSVPRRPSFGRRIRLALAS
jgi:hypothetical protein